MSTNTDESTDCEDGFSPAELRRMSEEEALEELDEEGYARWRKWRELDERAEETREAWNEQEQRVVEGLIEADMGELTTEVELFGNSVSVLVDLNDRQQDLASKVDAVYDAADMDDPSADDFRQVESLLAEFFASVFVEFNDVHESDVPAGEWEAIAHGCVDKWGLRGAFHALQRVIQETREADAELVGEIESFRRKERSRGRGSPPADRFTDSN